MAPSPPLTIPHTLAEEFAAVLPIDDIFHYYPAFTRLLALWLLGLQVVIAWIIWAIGNSVIGTGSDLNVELIFTGGSNCLVGVVALSNLLYTDTNLGWAGSASCLYALFNFALTAFAFAYIGLDMSMLPGDVVGYAPTRLYVTGMLFWVLSVLLQGILHTFLYTYGRMTPPSRKPYPYNQPPGPPLLGTLFDQLYQLCGAIETGGSGELPQYNDGAGTGEGPRINRFRWRRQSESVRNECTWMTATDSDGHAATNQHLLPEHVVVPIEGTPNGLDSKATLNPTLARLGLPGTGRFNSMEIPDNMSRNSVEMIVWAPDLADLSKIAGAEVGAVNGVPRVPASPHSLPQPDDSNSHQPLCRDVVYSGQQALEQFNPNLGNMRPISIDCRSTTTRSDSDTSSKHSINSMVPSEGVPQLTLQLHENPPPEEESLVRLRAPLHHQPLCREVMNCPSKTFDIESLFNPNIGLTRPISTDGRPATTHSDISSERSVSTVEGGNETSSLHQQTSVYSFNPLKNDRVGDRSSVETFVPAPGQLQMQPTRSYMQYLASIRPDLVDPEGMELGLPLSPHGQHIQNKRSQRHGGAPAATPNLGPQMIYKNSLKFEGKAVPAASPPIAGSCQPGSPPGLSPEPTPRQGGDYNLGPRMIFRNSFKFGGKAVHAASSLGPCQPILAFGHASGPVAHQEKDDGMTPASVFGGKSAQEALQQAELERLNFLDLE